MSYILHLNRRREFFVQIAVGTKQSEYRGRTPYWRRRLEGRHYGVIQFRNGCATKAPEMLVEFLGLRRIRKRLQCLRRGEAVPAPLSVEVSEGA